MLLFLAGLCVGCLALTLLNRHMADSKLWTRINICQGPSTMYVALNSYIQNDDKCSFIIWIKREWPDGKTAYSTVNFDGYCMTEAAKFSTGEQCSNTLNYDEYPDIRTLRNVILEMI